MTDVLEVRMGDKSVGKLTLLTGDRSFFAFEEDYLDDPERPVLSQSFMTASGDVIPETGPFRQGCLPFFRTSCLRGICANTLRRAVGSSLPGSSG